MIDAWNECDGWPLEYDQCVQLYDWLRYSGRGIMDIQCHCKNPLDYTPVARGREVKCSKCTKPPSPAKAARVDKLAEVVGDSTKSFWLTLIYDEDLASELDTSVAMLLIPAGKLTVYEAAFLETVPAMFNFDSLETDKDIEVARFFCGNLFNFDSGEEVKHKLRPLDLHHAAIQYTKKVFPNYRATQTRPKKPNDDLIERSVLIVNSNPE